METTELEQLLSSGDWENALPKLQEYLKEDVEEGEKGRIFVMIVENYMKSAAELNEKESFAIREILGLLQEVDQKEQKFDDDSGLAKARAALEE